MFKIIEAKEEKALDDIRDLFLVYGQERSFDKALGDYEQEIKGLPGKYGPPDGMLLIAYADEVPAGCVAYQKIHPEVCEMKRLYVSKNFRKMGLGKLLSQNIIFRARSHGYKTMKLDTHPSMISAQQLYAALGFSRTNRYNQNPIPGILFFEKELV